MGLEEKLLLNLIFFPNEVIPQFYARGINLNHFKNELIKRIVAKIFELFREDREFTIEDLIEIFKDEEEIVSFLKELEKLSLEKFKEPINDLIDEFLLENLRKKTKKFLVKALQELEENPLKSISSLTNEIEKVYDEFLPTKFDEEIEFDFINTVEENIKIGFPIFMEKTGGFITGLYTIAGGAGVGKTTFLLQILYQVLKLNKNCEVFFVSFDNTKEELFYKFVSLDSEVPIEYIKFSNRDNRMYEVKLKKSLKQLKNYMNFLTVVDERGGFIDFDFLLNTLYSWAFKNHNKKKMVFIDSISMLKTDKFNLNEEVNYIAKQLKAFSTITSSVVFITANLDKNLGTRRPKLEDFKNLTGIVYYSNILTALYCDFLVNPETTFLEWEWGTDDVMIPIVELHFLKNKISSFKDILFYRFRHSIAMYKECAREEIENYRDMIKNIENFKEKNKFLSYSKQNNNPEIL